MGKRLFMGTTSSSDLPLGFRVFTLVFGAHGGFGSLETEAAMRAVAEGLVDGAAAAAEREIRFSGQIILLAIGVYELDRALGSVHAERPVFSRHNFDLRHQLPPVE